jgi:AraC-like DNA-binding protein
MIPTNQGAVLLTLPPALAAIHSDLARLLADAQSAIGRNPDEARRCITRATALLEQPAEPPIHVSGGLATWQANRVRTYIADNLTETIAVEDLALLVGLSVSYFSRAFRASFGEAPYVHVLRQRIARACDLMVTTDEPLSQIAVACGLADQSHFTRLFRRFHGVTPHAWRRFQRRNTA